MSNSDPPQRLPLTLKLAGLLAVLLAIGAVIHQFANPKPSHVDEIGAYVADQIRREWRNDATMNCAKVGKVRLKRKSKTEWSGAVEYSVAEYKTEAAVEVAFDKEYTWKIITDDGKPLHKYQFEQNQVLTEYPVTEAEAQAFGAWTVTERPFDEEANSTLLAKQNGTYMVYMATQPGADKNAEADLFFQLLAGELSKKVFRGERLELHLCDTRLRSLKVIGVP